MARLISSIKFTSFIYVFLLSLCPLCSLKKGYAVEANEHIKKHVLTLEVNSLLASDSCDQSSKGSLCVSVIDKASSLQVLHKYGPCMQVLNDRSHVEFLRQDQLRVDSIQARLSKNSGHGTFEEMATKIPAQSGIALGTGNYVVTVGLGTPKESFTLEFDTASGITWTQCQPCLGSCYPQKEQKFDPTKSTSYNNVSCFSASCNLLPASERGCFASSLTCTYQIVYGDQSFSEGFFASETLTISSSDVITNFLFGCGQNNDGLFGQAAGLLGLSPSSESLTSQTAEKYQKQFSYCLPSSPSSTGYLNFGGKVSQTAGFTPLSPDFSSFYGIDIVGICVGGSQLPIDPSIFTTSGAIIDSGTVITRLPPTAYKALKEAFDGKMSNYPKTNGDELLDTCYDFSNYATVSFPGVSVSFKGGVEVDIDASGILYPVDGVKMVCLAFAANKDDSEFGIFGNHQQKTYEVIYDGANGMLGFASGGCS
ncbi:hypothetical protein POTOM_026244 [Populus tomentosa]|uniref:Peptidase A1 domain-containing protein n=1 Tax=Populus tomentosa TaxID=118781 RepID=A0A8X8CXP8_POPTO|nr:hypothetical protein POTOM_026244 [Populus tomentosa]